MRSLLIVASLAAALGALTGCGHKRRPTVTAIPPPPGTPAVVRPGQTEEGIASWYGHPYHGRQAADGEIYDMEKMTAAHRTLPFNTWVRVYDLDNRRPRRSASPIGDRSSAGESSMCRTPLPGNWR